MRVTKFFISHVVFVVLLSGILSGCSSNKALIQHLNTSDKPELIYVYDPLCGWCYGFSPIIQKFHQNHSDQYTLNIITGGMIIGYPKDSIGRLKDFFSESMPMLEENTSIKFGPGFKKTLATGTAIFSSEKPALALTVFKSFNTQKNLEFAGSIQRAIYFDGLEPELDQTYVPLAASLGVDTTEFKIRMQENEYLKKTYQDFELSAALKAGGYPTVFLLKDGKLHRLTDGYINLEGLEKEWEKRF